MRAWERFQGSCRGGRLIGRSLVPVPVPVGVSWQRQEECHAERDEHDRDEPAQLVRVEVDPDEGGETESEEDDAGEEGNGVEGVTLHEASDQRGAERTNTLVEKVEADHGILVDAIAVGDGPIDERLRALVDAAREAIVNAAKHSGVGNVSVYVEGRGDAVEAYVRDRGRGFDPTAVPGDRRGIADSIRGRVERLRGEVRITTAPGEGTEVRLRLPRLPGHEREEIPVSAAPQERRERSCLRREWLQSLRFAGFFRPGAPTSTGYERPDT